MIAALKERVDPDRHARGDDPGIRPGRRDHHPQTGQDELDFIKRRITDVGQLEFRITADPRYQRRTNRSLSWPSSLPPAQKEIYQGDNLVAEWVAYSTAEFGPPDQEDSGIASSNGWLAICLKHSF